MLIANTLRSTCYRPALQMEQFRQPQAVRGFREQSGEVEFETDGTCVNTTEGWKEMRLGIFSKRQGGAPATPEKRDTRSISKPRARCAFAALESSGRFARRWRHGARPGSAPAMILRPIRWFVAKEQHRQV